VAAAGPVVCWARATVSPTGRSTVPLWATGGTNIEPPPPEAVIGISRKHTALISIPGKSPARKVPARPATIGMFQGWRSSAVSERLMRDTRIFKLIESKVSMLSLLRVFYHDLMERRPLRFSERVKVLAWRKDWKRGAGGERRREEK